MRRTFLSLLLFLHVTLTFFCNPTDESVLNVSNKRKSVSSYSNGSNLWVGKKKSDKNIFFKLLLIVLICLSVLYSF